MNPAQLLNPKAFLKQKQKDDKKQQTKPSRKAPNHGPQQNRKPVAPSYDPQTLLNPKAAAMSKHVQRKPASDDATSGDSANGDIGTSRMLESLHGVTDREDVLQKKRKADVTSMHDDSDDEPKKHKGEPAQFSSNGGIIGDYLKAERKQLAPQAGPLAEPIDLTNDDDDEIQFIKDNGSTEVCLGVIYAVANASRVPAVSQSAQRNIPKTHWPTTKVTYSRERGQGHMKINLYDRTKVRFALLDIRTAAALCDLLEGHEINKLRLDVTLLSRPKKDGEVIGVPTSTAMQVHIQLFCMRRYADSIGKYLSQKQLFLQKPLTSGQREVYDPQAPKSYGGPGKTSGSQAHSSANYVSRTVEEIRREANTMFDNLAKNESLPLREPNSGIINTELMEHQKKALHFLVEHELDDFQGDELPAHILWRFRPKKNGQSAWYHVITGQEVIKRPAIVQGGILADMMGLGKTLSILALIAESKDKAIHFRQSRPEVEGVVTNAMGTLLICPKSVLSNWEEQIRNHCVEGKMSFYTYHGSNRSQDTDTLAKFDIVLTTYQTAANEFGDGIRKKTALSDINWFRIVLDEAHAIRNQSTTLFQGCCALNSRRRWAVTGTPVQNTLHDLGALVKFLRITPFDHPQTWNQYIMSPFKSGNVDVIGHLQLLVGSITLRRLKDTIGDLPGRRESVVRLQPSESERSLYRQFSTISRMNFSNLTSGGTQLRGKAYAHVLKAISRLRAICAHGREMLSEEDMKDIEGDDPNNAIVLDIGDEPGYEEEDFISDSQAYSIYKAMKDSEMDKCESCPNRISKPESVKTMGLDFDDSEEDEKEAAQGKKMRSGGKREDDEEYVEHSQSESHDESGETETNEGSDEDAEEQEGDEQDLLGHMTPCFHLICPDCTERYKQETAATMVADGWVKCPFDEVAQRFGMKPITRAGLRDYLEEREMAAHRPKAAKWDEESYSGPHTKVKALLKELKQSEEASVEKMSLGEPPVRSVVFSGWTSYLDLIEHALVKNKIGLVRLDGTMSVKQRSTVLEVFKTNPQATVMLVSIKAGGQGLNFTSANKVYVMEPQFNPGVSQQAVDRVHRLGQKRDVEITHYVMQDSIEEGILELQKKKIKLAQMSMEKKRSKAEENKERMADLRALFK